MLKLILGRAKTGKTAAVMEEIRKGLTGGGQSVLLVPEQYSHEAERELLSVCGDRMCLGAEVLSFTRLAARVEAELGVRGAKALDPGGRLLCLARAVDAVGARLRVFAAARRQTPLQARLLRAVDECKTCCVTPEALAAFAEARPDGDGTVALHIAVKDTGCGIPPERLAHLFDPREDDGAGRGCPGPGLGLSVVKRLLDSCGGAIDIDSAVGRGTGVYIRIGRLALADRPDEPAAKIAMPTVPDDFGVLVVDDVGVNLKVLALRVRKTGIKDVRTASSGEEALRLFAERRPHLVLTDLWMPGMDGVALAAAIRREGGTMPIVAITADSDARTSFDMSEFDGIITKPVSHDKLRAVIARAAKSIRPQQSAGRAQTKALP